MGKKEGKKKRPAEGVATADDDSDRGEGWSSSDSSDEDESDELVLEGVVHRAPGYTTSDEELSSEDEDGGGGPMTKKPRKIPLPEDYVQRKIKDGKGEKKKRGEKKKKKTARSEEPQVDTVNVDFLFCDMSEKFFHGMKTLLLSNPVYAPQSSLLSDLMIENVAVGTVISAEGYTDGDDDVFGFASVLNVTTKGSNPAIRYLKKLCLDNCPDEYKEELETVLSGETKRPAGFFVHNRMVNMPLEIVEVLHQQLVEDMDWAVKNAGGGEDERKSLDFGAFVILAPCFRSGGEGSPVYYKHFDDEVFGSNADIVYTFDIPQTAAMKETGEKPLCNVIVLTKTGHREGINQISKMIHHAQS